MNQLFSSLTNFVLIFPISSGVLKGTGNREQATVTSLEEDLDLSQTSSVLKDGASDQGNGQQYSSVDGTPVPCSLRGTHLGERVKVFDNINP